MELAMQLKEQTFLRERGRLLNFIRNRVSSLEEAEDILQDVFYQFIAGYDSIESLDRVTSWLFSVARNKIIDRYRRNSARPRQANFSHTTGADEEMPLTIQDILPDLGNTPEDAYLREVIWEEIMEALDELPPEQREVFVRNEIEDVSFRELAAEQGVSINTLLSRKRYAILALRKRLQKLYNEL
ncbi:MAG TPA: RNA polymerase sigma factor [Cyclobacteriaceae bacterium]|nr:RNA polymerase sigma factor [Cyclobacteriaceae bacterium]